MKNKAYWMSHNPELLMLAQTVAALFGYTLELSALGDKLLAVVNAVFALLAILGIAIDPTTEGLGDSQQAMSYTKPRED